MKLDLSPATQRWIDVYLFLNIVGYGGWHVFRALQEGRFSFIDGSFAAQTFVMAFVVLFRKRAVETNPNLLHQTVALAAFLSGVLFMGRPSTSAPSLLWASRLVILLANLLGILTLATLGKSFGVLIAFRSLRTGGIYSVVRHPMYGTDILLRIGYVISHFTPYTLVLFLLSTSCYVYRALLEERFLSGQAGYREYMERVPYRFIPHLF